MLLHGVIVVQFAGEFVTENDILTMGFDATSPDKQTFALVGFIGGVCLPGVDAVCIGTYCYCACIESRSILV
jgi:hypothetical protein